MTLPAHFKAMRKHCGGGQCGCEKTPQRA